MVLKYLSKIPPLPLQKQVIKMAELNVSELVMRSHTTHMKASRKYGSVTRKSDIKVELYTVKLVVIINKKITKMKPVIVVSTSQITLYIV